MKLLFIFTILFFSMNAFTETIKLSTGELLWKNLKSKTKISFHKAVSKDDKNIYYKPKCIFICYTGCKSDLAPIEGEEVLLTPWWDSSKTLFEKLPEPFGAYRIIVAQLYGGADNGEPNYSVQVNLSNGDEIIGYQQSNVSLDKMQIGGKVISDIDLQIEPDIFLRAECSYTRTR